MKQNRLSTAINILGTMVTIAFVMVVVMIFDFRTADIAPESDRSHLLYAGVTSTYCKKDHSDINGGMGKVAYEKLFTNLKGVEDETWYFPMRKSVCSIPASRKTILSNVHPVAANWFTFFHYKFIKGHPFTKEEYDAGSYVAVITESMAKKLFGSTDVVGKDFLFQFNPMKVVGVVSDVDIIFRTAYADAFTPFTICNEDRQLSWADGLGGVRDAILKTSGNADNEEIRTEVFRRLKLLNLDKSYTYGIKMQDLNDHVKHTFFSGSTINPNLVYFLLILILLVVPAINISGMTHAQLQERYTEIAVRKAYGATNISIVNQLFWENMITTLIGGILGYILSCVLVWFGRFWLLGDGMAINDINFNGGLLFRPYLFMMILVVCVIFNVLSVIIPTWIVTRKEIVETIKG